MGPGAAKALPGPATMQSRLFNRKDQECSGEGRTRSVRPSCFREQGTTPGTRRLKITRKRNRRSPLRYAPVDLRMFKYP